EIGSLPHPAGTNPARACSMRAFTPADRVTRASGGREGERIMEREKTRSTEWDRDRTSDRDRASDRDLTRAQGRSLEQPEYGSTSILGRDPRLSPGFEMMRTVMREMMRPFGELFGQGSSAM